MSHGRPAEDHRQAVIVADSEGVIRFWNGDAELLLGYRTDDAVGQSLDLIVPAAYRDAHWAGFHRAMATPALKDQAADLPVRCADGDVRTLAGRLVVLIDGLGRAAGAVAVFTDAGSTGVRPFG